MVRLYETLSFSTSLSLTQGGNLCFLERCMKDLNNCMRVIACTHMCIHTNLNTHTYVYPWCMNTWVWIGHGLMPTRYFSLCQSILVQPFLSLSQFCYSTKRSLNCWNVLGLTQYSQQMPSPLIAAPRVSAARDTHAHSVSNLHHPC